MKTLKRNLLFTFASGLTALLLSGPVHALTAGQFDFSDLSTQYGEPKVEVNLNANLMQIIGRFADQEDPEVAEILSKLETIQVRIYDLNEELETANAALDRVSNELKLDSWETLVTVNDNEENQKVRIFSKSTDQVIDGVVVMVVSPEKGGGEAVFINIVGEIDPANIAKVTDKINIEIN